MSSDDFSGVDISKIQEDIVKLIGQKAALYQELHECIKARDSKRIAELLVENAADDIDLVMKIRHDAKIDPGQPLGDSKEKLKLLLFMHLGLKDG